MSQIVSEHWLCIKDPLGCEVLKEKDLQGASSLDKQDHWWPHPELPKVQSSGMESSLSGEETLSMQMALLSHKITAADESLPFLQTHFPSLNFEHLLILDCHAAER